MKNIDQYPSVNSSQKFNKDQLNHSSSSFTLKSQSLKHQMQMMNDKLFETDKLISMQMSNKRSNGKSLEQLIQTEKGPKMNVNRRGLVRSSTSFDYAQTNACRRSSIVRGQANNLATNKIQSKSNSPFKYSINANVSQQKKLNSPKNEHSKSITIPTSPDKIERVGIQYELTGVRQDSQNTIESNNVTVNASEIKHITQNAPQELENATQSLDETMKTKKALRSEINKYISKNHSPREQEKYVNNASNKTLNILQEYFETEVQSDGSDDIKVKARGILQQILKEESNAESTPQVVNFAVIPENSQSMEFSNSIKNSGPMNGSQKYQIGTKEDPRFNQVTSFNSKANGTIGEDQNTQQEYQVSRAASNEKKRSKSRRNEYINQFIQKPTSNLTTNNNSSMMVSQRVYNSQDEQKQYEHQSIHSNLQDVKLLRQSPIRNPSNVVLESKKKLKALDINLANNRNAVSHAFLDNNEKENFIQSFQIAKSPSFIASQEHSKRLKIEQFQPQIQQRRNHSSCDVPKLQIEDISQKVSQIKLGKSHKSRSNHQQIKEKILIQNSCHKSQSSLKHNETNQLRNHLNSVQNFQNNHVMQYNGLVNSYNINQVSNNQSRVFSVPRQQQQQNINNIHNQLIDQNDSVGYEQPFAGSGQVIQSTNTWSQMMPSQHIPEQIHNNLAYGEGDNGVGVPLDSKRTNGTQQQQTQDNFQQLINQNDSCNSQNLKNFSQMLKNLQNSNKVYNQSGEQVTDPKNLRNFFIQSSLTFNGNNQSRQQTQENDIPAQNYYLREENNKLDQSPTIKDHDPSLLVDENPYEADESLAINMINQYSLNPNNNFNNYSMINASNDKQYQTQQQMNDKRVMKMINEEGTSGFFSGQEMANVRGALQDFDDPSMSKLFQSNAYCTEGVKEVAKDSIDNCDNSLVGPSGLLNHAFQSNSVFDLPSAVNEIYRSLQQIEQLKAQLQQSLVAEQEQRLSVKIANDGQEQLQQELVQIETEKLEIEQEMLELVEQRQEMKNDNKNMEENIQFQNQLIIELKQQLNLSEENNQNEAVQQQLTFMQDNIKHKQSKMIDLENQNIYFQNRDIQIQSTVHKLKSKYKQRLIQKQCEVDQIKLQFSELQQLFNSKIDEFAQIQSLSDNNHSQMVEGTTGLGSFGPQPNSQNNKQFGSIDYSDPISDLQRKQLAFNSGQNSTQTILSGQQSDNLLNMRQNSSFNKTPNVNITKELEHLRQYISELVSNLFKNQQEQFEQMRHGGEQAFQSSRSKLVKSESVQELNYAVQNIKDILNDANNETSQKIQLQNQKINIVQKQNDMLQVENAKLRQNSHGLQNDLVQLQQEQMDAESKMFKKQLINIENLRQKNRELEDFIVKMKVSVSNKRQTQEATKFNEQLKQIVGFVLSKLGYKHKEVPKNIADYLSSYFEVDNQQLQKIKQLINQRLSGMLEQKCIIDQIQPLQSQNHELVKLLNNEEKNRRQLLNQLQEIKGNIRVLCRVRPVLASEKKRGEKLAGYKMTGNDKLLSECTRSNLKKTFQFDKVFKASSKQKQVFDEVQGLIESAMLGYNVCMLAYGQTGSGKTYTMVGDDKNPGLYFTTVDEVYNHINRKQDQIEYDISVSVVEIYNEQMRDLLCKNQEENKFKIMEGTDGNLHGNQIKRKVKSKNHILKALRDACFNRTVGVTQFNEYSSRSHFIMTLFITGYNQVSKQVIRGKMSLVDLAGSERILNTNAEGIRILEAQNINQSLATLGKVILSLQNKQSHIPYRESKLTHYLKDSIGGNAKTIMIIQVSPLQKDIQESHSTLGFGQRTQYIEKGKLKANVSFENKALYKSMSARSFKSSAPQKGRKNPRSVSACSNQTGTKYSVKKNELRTKLSRSVSALTKSVNVGNRKLINSMVDIPRSRSRTKLTVKPKTRSRKELKKWQNNSKEKESNFESHMLGIDKSASYFKEVDELADECTNINMTQEQNYEYIQPQNNLIGNPNIEGSQLQWSQPAPLPYISDPSSKCSTSQFVHTDRSQEQKEQKYEQQIREPQVLDYRNSNAPTSQGSLLSSLCKPQIRLKHNNSSTIQHKQATPHNVNHIVPQKLYQQAIQTTSNISTLIGSAKSSRTHSPAPQTQIDQFESNVKPTGASKAVLHRESKDTERMMLKDLAEVNKLIADIDRKMEKSNYLKKQ